jgi:hypothetical protein
VALWLECKIGFKNCTVHYDFSIFLEKLERWKIQVVLRKSLACQIQLVFSNNLKSQPWKFSFPFRVFTHDNKIWKTWNAFRNKKNVENIDSSSKWFGFNLCVHIFKTSNNFFLDNKYHTLFLNDNIFACKTASKKIHRTLKTNILISKKITLYKCMTLFLV